MYQIAKSTKMKVYISKKNDKNEYEEFIETPENQFAIDGYCIRSQSLEGVMFNVTFDPITNKVISITNDQSDDDYLDDFNLPKVKNEIAEYAKRALSTGDEVEIPRILKNKYYHPKYGGVAALSKHKPIL